MIKGTTAVIPEETEDKDGELAGQLKKTRRPGFISLREEATQIFSCYFRDLEPGSVTGFYQIFLSEFEPALYESVMAYTRGNQSEAAAILKINRGTLRRKLRRYGLLG